MVKYSNTFKTILLCLILAVFTIMPSFAKDLGTKKDIDNVVLIKSGDGKAVIKFEDGPLETIEVGDTIGRNKAVVKEIIPERVVLDESFEGKDGKPNRADIVLTEGEKGGMRIQRRLDEPPLVQKVPKIAVIPLDRTTEPVENWQQQEK